MERFELHSRSQPTNWQKNLVLYCNHKLTRKSSGLQTSFFINGNPSHSFPNKDSDDNPTEIQKTNILLLCFWCSSRPSLVSFEVYSKFSDQIHKKDYLFNCSSWLSTLLREEIEIFQQLLSLHSTKICKCPLSFYNNDIVRKGSVMTIKFLTRKNILL